MKRSLRHLTAAGDASATELAAAGVDVPFVREVGWAVCRLVVRRLGPAGTRRLLRRWAAAIDKDFVQRIDGPGPDTLLDPILGRSLLLAADALAHYLVEKAD